MLGYSERGSLDYSSSPAYIKAFLDRYAQGISLLKSADGSQGGTTITYQDPVNPLLGISLGDKVGLTTFCAQRTIMEVIM